MIPTMKRLMEVVHSANLLNEAVDVSSSEFLRWFRKSMVVDSQGNPQRVFHGTSHDFHSFRGMVWASVTPKLAHEYADNPSGNNIMPLYMRIERPFDADLGLSRSITIGDFFNAAIEQAADGGFLTDNLDGNVVFKLRTMVQEAAKKCGSGPNYPRHYFWNHATDSFGQEGADAIGKLFKLLGFDGVCMIEQGEVTYGAFSPEQVKSFFNKGSFNDGSNISEVRDS